MFLYLISLLYVPIIIASALIFSELKLITNNLWKSYQNIKTILMTASLKFEQILDSACFIIIRILLQRYTNTLLI